jgi:predicted transcriptional regulator
LKNKPLDRQSLVIKIGKPRTTIYDALNVLLKAERVKKYPVYNEEQSRGRPRVVFSVAEMPTNQFIKPHDQPSKESQ